MIMSVIRFWIVKQNAKSRFACQRLVTLTNIRQFRTNSSTRHFRLPRSMNKNFALLGCYETSIRTKSRTFRDNLSVPPSKIRQFECLTLEDGTDRLSRNVGNLPPINAPLTSQHSEDLTYYNFGSTYKHQPRVGFPTTASKRGPFRNNHQRRNSILAIVYATAPVKYAGLGNALEDKQLE